MSPRTNTTAGPLRCAMRALRDPSIVDGAGPGSRRRFRRRQDDRAARYLLDVLITMQTQR